ncbi:hypothetical protein Hamer_G023741, partial [Homarus americanus]
KVDALVAAVVVAVVVAAAVVVEEWMAVELLCVLETGSANSASSITSLHVISASSALPQNDVRCSPPSREHPGPRRRTCYGGSGNTTRDIYFKC